MLQKWERWKCCCFFSVDAWSYENCCTVKTKSRLLCVRVSLYVYCLCGCYIFYFDSVAVNANLSKQCLLATHTIPIDILLLFVFFVHVANGVCSIRSLLWQRKIKALTVVVTTTTIAAQYNLASSLCISASSLPTFVNVYCVRHVYLWMATH